MCYLCKALCRENVYWYLTALWFRNYHQISLELYQICQFCNVFALWYLKIDWYCPYPNERNEYKYPSFYEINSISMSHLERTQGNVLSIALMRAYHFLSYCMSKVAWDQFTRCVTLDAAPKELKKRRKLLMQLLIWLMLRLALSLARVWQLIAVFLILPCNEIN